MVNRGGAVIALKTQRYEADDRIMLDLGWSYVRYKRTAEGKAVQMDRSEHFSKSLATMRVPILRAKQSTAMRWPTEIDYNSPTIARSAKTAG